MAIFKRGKFYSYEFVFDGKRVRESVKTTSRTLALEAERIRRRELEKVRAGVPVENRTDRIQSVSDAITVYLETFGINHRSKTVVNVKGRLAHVKRLIGSLLLPDVTDRAIKQYIQIRIEEGMSGRTINMEVAELSRAIGKPWSALWPKVRKLEENQDVGKALSAEEEQGILRAADGTKSQLMPVFLRLGLLTGMRCGEMLGLNWGRADLGKRVITVGRAKSSCGTGRQIPMNGELFNLLSVHRDWMESRFGRMGAAHYVFPFGSPTPTDPTKPATTIKTAWETIRKRAGVDCRLHDLRHTVATKMAEAGVPESTMLALLGHMSRRMLERYSHIRMAAKRQAVETLTTKANLESVPTKIPTTEQTASIN